jgi:hypothetical protein
MIDLIVDKPKYTVEKLPRGDYLVSSDSVLYGTFDSIRDLRKYMGVVVDDFEYQLPYGNMQRNFKVVTN